jgi:hypothetical protein
MIAEHQIRQWLARFLHGEVSLDQFEDWFVQRSWNMHRDSDDASQKLASAIELRLAEYSSGHLSDEQLHNELLPFVTNYSATVHFGSDAQDVISFDAQNNSPSPRVLVIPAEPEFRLSDTQPVAVF